MEYHVLSNFEVGKILIYGGIFSAILWAVFGYLANRDASPKQPTKSLWRKILAWVVFCILLSDICLFIYRCTNYPWGLEPQPSQASVYREIKYMGSGYPLWGWANDYQLPLLTSFAGVLLWFSWTIYAFKFKYSDTSWWKKACKIIAYILISVTILGFQIHEFGDLLGYVIILVVFIALLWIAHVTPDKQEENKPAESTVIKQEQTPNEVLEEDKVSQNEDPSRFMPKATVFKEAIVPTPIGTPNPIEQVEVTHEKETTPPEPVIEEDIESVAATTEESRPQNITHSNEMDMMYCKYCGKKIEADSTFCKYCGRRL